MKKITVNWKTLSSGGLHCVRWRRRNKSITVQGRIWLYNWVNMVTWLPKELGASRGKWQKSDAWGEGGRPVALCAAWATPGFLPQSRLKSGGTSGGLEPQTGWMTSELSILFLTALLRYSLHIIQFTHLNVKLFSVYSQSGTVTPAFTLARFHHPQRTPTPLAVTLNPSMPSSALRNH